MAYAAGASETRWWPFLAGYLKQGFPSIRLRWLLRYRKWIHIADDTGLPFTKVKYYDANEEEIKLV